MDSMTSKPFPGLFGDSDKGNRTAGSQHPPAACRAGPACTPPPSRTRPPKCCPGRGNRSAGAPGTHSPSAGTPRHAPAASAASRPPRKGVENGGFCHPGPYLRDERLQERGRAFPHAAHGEAQAPAAPLHDAVIGTVFVQGLRQHRPDLRGGKRKPKSLRRSPLRLWEHDNLCSRTRKLDWCGNKELGADQKPHSSAANVTRAGKLKHSGHSRSRVLHPGLEKPNSCPIRHPFPKPQNHRNPALTS